MKYAIATHIILAGILKLVGTAKIKTATIASGNANLFNQGLAFPSLVCVLSTLCPM